MANESSTRKVWWQIFIESSGGTALITVFLGGIIGSIISGSIQSNIKEKEFKNSFLNSYSKTQLEFSKNFLAKQSEATKNALDLVSKAINSCNNLVLSKGPLLNTQNNQSQVKALRDKFNEVTDEWEESKYSIGFLLAHYHNSSLESINWVDVINKGDELITCSSDFEPSRADFELAIVQTKNACSLAKQDLLKSIDVLLNNLQEKTEKEWIGFKSYDQLKIHLGL